MKLNTPEARPPLQTHEGAPARHISITDQLRRSVMSCMLWEDEFYEDGEQIAKRIGRLVALVEPAVAAGIAVSARKTFKLRHVPLLIVSHMAGLCSSQMGRSEETRRLVASTLAAVIERADELAEFLAIHQKLNPGKPLKKTLSAQIKKGLAASFVKFDAYQLAKYDRAGAIRLRDVLFLCHAKPQDGAQAYVWKQLIDGTLEAPDTWEVALSGGADKKATWERLIAERKLGGLALLRNLRNMQQAGVPDDTIRGALTAMKTERILPFRFIAAARFAAQLEPELEASMFRCLESAEKLSGKTVLMVDVSGSMDAPVSRKSDLHRVDAACALAMLLREICEKIYVVTFSDKLTQVAPRRGFALRDEILRSQPHSGTALGASVRSVMQGNPDMDRLIVISDEQSRDPVPAPPKQCRAYMLNVASAENGVGYGPWQHIDGFSESVVNYIRELEAAR